MVSVTGELAVEVRGAELGSEQETPAGDPTTLHERFTVPVNPLVGVTKRLAVALEPGVTATRGLAEVMEKSDNGLLSAVLSV